MRQTIVWRGEDGDVNGAMVCITYRRRKGSYRRMQKWQRNWGKEEKKRKSGAMGGYIYGEKMVWT